jgi:hypothetical protein
MKYRLDEIQRDLPIGTLVSSIASILVSRIGYNALKVILIQAGGLILVISGRILNSLERKRLMEEPQ